MHRTTIAIAISGGIDSMMTTALLKDQGHQLIGLHFLTGFEPYLQSTISSAALTTNFAPLEDQARQLLTPMSDQLRVPIHIIDLRETFKNCVVDYFERAYQEGKTPNPCLMCNPAIKFGALFESAKKYGATHIATGHYARLQIGIDGRARLFRGIDHKKDQSYFLAGLRQDQLKTAILPLGGFTKEQTRQMAEKKGLQPAAAQESQDICFINKGTYSDFLSQQPGFTAKPGPIEDLNGTQLGQHEGLHLFTVGQRRGINCPAAEPYYVIRIDSANNRLIVGRKQELQSRSFEVQKINWIAPKPQEPIRITVRIRYRHRAVLATLIPTDKVTSKIIFDTPEPAVTPGQGAVFYDNDEVLGGGWIQ